MAWLGLNNNQTPSFPAPYKPNATSHHPAQLASRPLCQVPGPRLRQPSGPARLLALRQRHGTAAGQRHALPGLRAAALHGVGEHEGGRRGRAGARARGGLGPAGWGGGLGVGGCCRSRSRVGLAVQWPQGMRAAGGWRAGQPRRAIARVGAEGGCEHVCPPRVHRRTRRIRSWCWAGRV